MPGCPCRRSRPRAGSSSRSRRSAAAGSPGRAARRCGRDQRDLGGAGQVQVVVGGAEDLLLVGGQEAGPEHRLPPDQHRRDHGHEPGRRQPVHGEADQGELEQRPRPDQVAEAGPGHLGRPDGVDRAQQLAQLQVVADGEVEVPRGADPAQLDRVLLAAGRDGLLGRVGHAGLDLGQGGVGGAQAVLGRVEPVSDSSLRPARTRSRSSGAALATSRPRRFCSARRASTSVTRRRRSASASSSRSTWSATPGPRLARAALTRSGSSRTSFRSSMPLGYLDRRDRIRPVAPMARVMAARSSSERLWPERLPMDRLGVGAGPRRGRC